MFLSFSRVLFTAGFFRSALHFPKSCTTSSKLEQYVVHKAGGLPYVVQSRGSILPVIATTRKKRIPALKFTDSRGIGWYVAIRDPQTGQPSKHRFGMVTEAEAQAAYYDFLASRARGVTPTPNPKLKRLKPSPDASPKTVDVIGERGSLMDVLSGFLTYQLSRVRTKAENERGERRQDSIDEKQFNSKRALGQRFLEFLNARHGQGAVAAMRLSDLSMEDIEAYNQYLVKYVMKTGKHYSHSHVKKCLETVKEIIDNAGRPEHGRQLLSWNWDSRRVYYGLPPEEVTLPTVQQLKKILAKCDKARTLQVWLSIGCGFSQSELAVLTPDCFDRQSYDCRRLKTQLDRYGDTPKLVWVLLQDYLKENPREAKELLFRTEDGFPLVHDKTDSVQLWWQKLCTKLKIDRPHYYSLRHLGATEYGNRDRCSISDMRRWLGHSTSSAVADGYMKPIAPEIKPVVQWVGRALTTGKFSVRL